MSVEATFLKTLVLRIKKSRGGQIRTDDFLLPKQALYQAELRPVRGGKLDCGLRTKQEKSSAVSNLLKDHPKSPCKHPGTGQSGELCFP